MEVIDIVIIIATTWLAYKVLKLGAIASIVSNLPVQLIFPLRLEYTNNQWFAWDKEHEFLGQAQTKEELIIRLSKELDFPKDNFIVISEKPIKQPNL